MQEKIITLATPVFFLLIFIELIVGLARRRNTYRFNDAINSISLGVLSQVFGVFMKLLQIGIYAWLVQHVAFLALSRESIWVWLSGSLLYDLSYYWLPRMGHEVNVLWAAHVVHHQSEDYNLSTALRQTSSGALLGWIFYVPMALLGYPLEVFVAVALIDLLYQFWVHTQQIGKLGWFDRIFVSPSNHRVHHGVNDIYLDKNYGGILILWDRLFGTFIEERNEEPVIYGTRNPLRSWNPVTANFEVYGALCHDTWHSRRWMDKLRVWVAPPGWRPPDVAAALPNAPFDLLHPRFHPPMSRITQIYCLLQFSAVLLTATHFLASHATLSPAHCITYALWLGAGLWIIGGLMERDVQSLALEALRVTGSIAGVILCGSWFGGIAFAPIIQVGIAAFSLVSLATLWIIFKQLPAEHGNFSDQ